MKKKLFATGALVVVLSLGYAVSVAVAEKPPAPPGQGECGHGNTDKPCKTDPSTNGKDCDEHGNNGGVNEDHCLATAPTTSSTNQTSTGETTTSQTTTTSTSTSSTTSTTTPSSSTSSTSTSSTSTTGSTTATTTGSSSTSETSTEATTTSSPPVGATPPAKPPKAHATSKAHSGPTPKLPFTGVSLRLIATLAALALLLGLIARHRTKPRRP